jgi:hypothetical protein
MISTYQFVLDLQSTQSNVTLPITRTDTNRQIRISFSDGGKPVSLANITKACLSIKGNGVHGGTSIDIDNTEVLIDLKNWFTAPGIYDCEITLFSGDFNISAPKFYINVAETNNTDIPLDDVEELPDFEQFSKDEGIRIANEEARVQAESSRVTAESKRVTAEIDRVNYYEKLQQDVIDGKYNGKDGQPGEPGITPVVTVTPAPDKNGVLITVTAGGTTTQQLIYNGSAGKDGTDGDTPYIKDGYWWIGSTNTGTKATEPGPQGPAGEPFKIVKTYSSISAMNSDFGSSNVSEGSFVIINTGNVSDEDNGKLYVKGETKYEYLFDMSGLPGIQGPPGKDGKDGQPGKDGTNGANGLPGATGVGIVQIVKTGTSGLVDTYTVVLSDGNKYTFTVTNAKPPVKGEDYFTASDRDEIAKETAKYVDAIIDVGELPTDNIDTNSFYRVPKGTFYYGNDKYPAWACIIVETLPSEGVPVTHDMENFTFYYESSSNSVPAYVDEALGTMIGMPIGWYPIEMVTQMMNLEWGGIVFDEANISDISRIYLILKYELYQSINEQWVKVGGSVGFVGEGEGAEKFNTTRNQASGNYSHAEGYLTWATGDYSHAEGLETVARGHHSHTEGQGTVANGEHQHVQGKYNLEDTENKYAHIVGNGDSTNPSNAHTLDWDGNAWYQGGLKVGGTGQNDPNAKQVATTDELQNKISKFSVELTGDENVADIINKLQEANPDYELGVWSLIEFKGAASGLYGLTIHHYGGNVYNIGGIDFSTGWSMANSVKDWSQVSVWEFSSQFAPPLPYYDDSMSGAFLTLQSNEGIVAPTWTLIPNAEESDF